MDASEARRYLGLAILTLALSAVAGAAWWVTASHEWIGRFSDSISYLLFADYYNGASHGRYAPGIERFYQTTRFPPLFGLVLSLAGVGSAKVQLAAAVTQALVVLGMAAIAAYLVRATRDLLLGALLLVPIVLCTGPFLVSLDPVSEPLFTLLVYAGLACSYDRLRTTLTPLLFALAPLTRLAGVCLGPALALWLWRSADAGGRWRKAATGLVVLLPMLVWMLYRRGATPPQESYSGVLASDALVASYGGWTGWLLGQPARLFTEFLGLFDPHGGVGASVALLATCALALAGGVVRFRRNELDVQVAGFYLGMVFVWPFPAEQARLLGMVVPVVVVCCWEGWRALLARVRAWSGDARALAAALLTAAVLALTSAPTAALVVRRALADVPEDLEPYKRSAPYLLERDDAWALGQLEVDARVRFAIESLAGYVPAGDCVYSLSPMRTAVYGKRNSERMPAAIRPDIPVRAQFATCRYLLVTLETTRQQGEPLLFPAREVRHIASPVFMSQFPYQGRDVIAAMLLQFNE